MNEQNEHANEPFEQVVQPVSLEEAARRLGLSRDAVRMRVARGRLHGRRVGRELLIFLPGEQHERTANEQRTNSEQPFRTVFASDQDARIAELERERDQLAEDKRWLMTQFEARGVELAEMRRLLGNAQQQLEGMVRALPSPTTAAEIPPQAAETAATPSNAITPIIGTSETVARALKAAGVKKKQRRRLLGRLAAALGLNG